MHIDSSSSSRAAFITMTKKACVTRARDDKRTAGGHVSASEPRFCANALRPCCASSTCARPCGGAFSIILPELPSMGRCLSMYTTSFKLSRSLPANWNLPLGRILMSKFFAWPWSLTQMTHLQGHGHTHTRARTHARTRTVSVSIIRRECD